MVKPRKWLVLLIAVLVTAALAPAAVAHPDGPDTGVADDGHEHELTGPEDPSAALAARDAIVSDGPSAEVVKNLTAAGFGERDVAGATTDVWAHNGYAYTGTFNSPCGGDPDAGVWVWDVRNKTKPSFVSVIPSPTGSRSNDVKVATMNSGEILVHSNESCAGGPGGFEIYNVDDPSNPVHLDSVQTDDVNGFLRDNFGFVDFGVHNLFLFTQGENDYVAATVESEFGNFQIFDITDPGSPALVGWWGAEELRLAELGLAVDPADIVDFGLILDLDAYLFSGFGASANKFLHDITVTADGTHAYLANWDAGLVLLDISDPADPQLVSVAIDPLNGSLDGEVNSHSVWPSEDGTIVVEGEEDFSAWEATVPPSNVTFGGNNLIPGVMAATTTGDAFEASQTGNAGSITANSVRVDSGPLTGSVFPASEFSGNNFPLGEGSFAGNFVWIGRGCNGDSIANSVEAGDIAVVRRGACTFAEKANNAAAAGAGAIVVTNNNSTSTPWSGLRIWDYSDPSNPELKSTFNTTCSAASLPGGDCAADGTYSSHNVIVETDDDGRVKAYISWYNDGIVIIDVTDPANPVEIARYLESGQDFWGIDKIPGEPWIYGSDRNGGLVIAKEYGSGSAKKGRN
jgi:hypothetical protein